MISYCIACYRPVYSRLLIDDLIRKTSVPYEILLWINVADEEFDRFLAERVASNPAIKIVGRTPENIGMTAYYTLFSKSLYGLVVQIDDDVVCIGPNIAQTAADIFARHPRVGMLTADVWQDDQTTGARPPMEHYRVVDEGLGLYDGPIDGWFAVYQKRALFSIRAVNPGRYGPLGGLIRQRLAARRMQGLLCTRMKVFHVIGPYYASHFGMLESEIRKYRDLGRMDLVEWYEKSVSAPPPQAETAARVRQIQQHLS